MGACGGGEQTGRITQRTLWNNRAEKVPRRRTGAIKPDSARPKYISVELPASFPILKPDHSEVPIAGVDDNRGALIQGESSAVASRCYQRLHLNVLDRPTALASQGAVSC